MAAVRRRARVPETGARERPATRQRQHVTGADVDSRGGQTSRLPLAAAVDRDDGFRPRAVVRAEPVHVVRAVAARRDAMVWPHVRSDAVRSRTVRERHGRQLRPTRLRRVRTNVHKRGNKRFYLDCISCNYRPVRSRSTIVE